MAGVNDSAPRWVATPFTVSRLFPRELVPRSAAVDQAMCCAPVHGMVRELNAVCAERAARESVMRIAAVQSQDWLQSFLCSLGVATNTEALLLLLHAA